MFEPVPISVGLRKGKQIKLGGRRILSPEADRKVASIHPVCARMFLYAVQVLVPVINTGQILCGTKLTRVRARKVA